MRTLAAKQASVHARVHTSVSVKLRQPSSRTGHQPRRPAVALFRLAHSPCEGTTVVAAALTLNSGSSTMQQALTNLQHAPWSSILLGVAVLLVVWRVLQFFR